MQETAKYAHELQIITAETGSARQVCYIYKIQIKLH